MTGTKPRTRVVELPTQWLRDHMSEALTIYGLAVTCFSFSSSSAGKVAFCMISHRISMAI